LSADPTALPSPAVRPAATLPRVLAGLRPEGPLPLDAHLARYGVLPLSRRSTDLIELVEAAGLTGRGGAGFPAGRKLRAVADAGRSAVVVANGVEGEPVSHKDKLLLRLAPQLVLDGAALAAAAVGAREAIVAVGAGARREISSLRAALAERGSRVDRVKLSVVTVPEGFVPGEETALVSWLNGKPPRPTSTPPRPFERGVRGAPTLVQNVETLANMALVARFGPSWFRGLGTREEPGTVLVTVGGAVARRGIYEIPLGFPLRDLLARAGGASEPLSAFLLGGYFGTWVPAEAALGAGLLDSELRPLGASLGARAIVALPASACGLRETARVARYLARESAGQCGPCLHGLAAIAGALERLAGGKAEQGDRTRLERWTGQVAGRGACRHPDGAAQFVESALRVFAHEIDWHTRKRCSGGAQAWLPVPR
jgi:NADH:ubiquinone oxidoreductase subunit F (NADH-binding)